MGKRSTNSIEPGKRAKGATKFNSVARFTGFDHRLTLFPQLKLWAIDCRSLRELNDTISRFKKPPPGMNQAGKKNNSQVLFK